MLILSFPKTSLFTFFMIKPFCTKTKKTYIGTNESLSVTILMKQSTFIFFTTSIWIFILLFFRPENNTQRCIISRIKDSFWLLIGFHQHDYHVYKDYTRISVLYSILSKTPSQSASFDFIVDSGFKSSQSSK